MNRRTSLLLKKSLCMFALFNIAKGKVVTRFSAVAPVQGHPDAENIFSVLRKVVGPDGFNLPLTQVVSQTSDGAATILSTIRGVAAKAKEAFTPKLFIQDCFNHRLVLAGKDGQHHIPSEVEATIKDVLNHFKFSAVGQSRLKSILNKEKYVKLVSYHKNQVVIA